MNLFLIGINGIGMQALAIIARQSGFKVTGFDDAANDEHSHIAALTQAGINYENEIPDDTNYVVYSSAIKETHRLMIDAHAKNIPCINRTDFLTDYIKFNPEKILIAGAHGKTTTTSMCAYVLGMKSYAIGGMVNGYKCAGNNETDKYTVIETDESDGSFIKWQGKYKILLNADFEHMDFFKTENCAIDYYRKFALNDIETTQLILSTQAKIFLDISQDVKTRENVILYGPHGSDAHFTYNNIKTEPNGLYFDITNHIIKITQEIFVPLLGEHNASNFTAVYALCSQLGMKHDEIAQKIATFPGAKKRMQKIMEQNGFAIYSDYGHHPQEVNAVLNAVWNHKKIRPNIILEPHRYSRMLYTWQQWPDVLRNNKVFITPIHTASEMPIEGITTENFIEYLRKNNVDAHALSDFSQYNADNETICFSAGKLSSALDKLSK